MSSGPKNVTSTTNQEPPKYIEPYLKQVAGAAGGAFGGGGGPGSNLLPTAQGLTQSTLEGKFLSPESNPYLSATFNQGADRILQRLNTGFGQSGRDLAAARPAGADELGSFASSLYGNAYNFERGNQIGAISDANAQDPLNLFINRLAGIIPGAGGSTQSTQPVFKTGLFSDRRLKRNIERIGTVKGLPWYSFEYIWGEKAEGFMSDEVPQQYVNKGIYDTVDYVAIMGGA